MLEVFIITLLFIGLTYSFGLLYMIVNNKISTNLKLAFGWKGFCIFASIGTPFHELTHLLMSWLFLHKVTEVKFFRPIKSYKEYKQGQKNITLGYVNHSYKKTPYRIMGNFFIGASPMIIGMGSIVLILRLLFPESFIDISALNINNLKSFIANILLILFNIFSKDNMLSWKFWLLIFIIVAIASHMNMSIPDIKGTFNGLLPLIILTQLSSIILVIFTGLNYTQIYNFYLMITTYYLFILIFGLVISLILWALFYSINIIKKST